MSRFIFGDSAKLDITSQQNLHQLPVRQSAFIITCAMVKRRVRKIINDYYAKMMHMGFEMT